MDSDPDEYAPDGDPCFHERSDPGFVGFVIPHISRSIVGAAHKRLIWFSVLLGAIFVVWADLFARIMFSPQELPVGVITSLCGTPAFLWMLRKSRYSFSK